MIWRGIMSCGMTGFFFSEVYIQYAVSDVDVGCNLMLEAVPGGDRLPMI